MPTLSATRNLLKRRWLRWCIILLLGYTVFGFLILPLIVRAVAIKQLSSQLNRKVGIRKVRINPYVLSASIQGLLIKDEDGQPFISWDEIYGNFQLSSFFGKAWVFKEVHASNPFIRVQINKDYTFNFSDLLKKFSQKSATPRSPRKPLLLEIDRLHVAGAQAQVTDLTPPTPFHRTIGPIEVTLTGFHTDPNSRNPYAFAGTTDAGERFSWNGYFSLDPIQSAGDISFEGFSLPKYSPLYEDLVRFEIRDGVAGFRGAYEVALAGTNWSAAVSNAVITLKNFKAAEKAASNNVIGVDSLVVQGLSADTAGRVADISSVSVDGARLAAKRAPTGDLNLVTLSQPSDNMTNPPGGILLLLEAATNAVAALINTTNLWRGTLHDFEVTNCALSWEDSAMRRPVRATMDQITVTAKHLSNVPGSNQTASISLRWNTNGLMRIQADAQIEPPAFAATIQVTNLDLQPVDPYLEPFVNVYIRRSKLDVEGHLQMRLENNQLPEATFTGSVHMNDFSSVDGLEENDLVNWSSLRIDDLTAALNPPSITVKTVALVDPVAHVVIETNSQLNVLAVLRATDTNVPASAAQPVAEDIKVAKTGIGARFGAILRQVLDSGTNNSPSGLPPINVDQVTISNGVVRFEDRSVQPPVHTSIEALNGKVSGFSSSNLKRADISISGKANRTGPFEITGKINPLSTNAPTELLVKFNDVDLKAGSPYSGKFLGYKLNRGFLSLAVNYHVSGRRLVASNLVTIDHLTLGDKVESADATKLPVRLAVALLKDRNGRIQLDVPIDGNLDDPNFHFGKVIAHVLGNVITKLVTSPFAALGSVFGGKGEDISFIDFEPGRADSTPNADSKIERLLHGLDERPGLQLEISAGFDPVSDGDVIRGEKLEHELRSHRWSLMRKSVQAQTNIDQIVLSSSDRTDALKALYQAMAKTNSEALKTPASRLFPRPSSAPAAPAGIETTDHGAEMLVRASAAQFRPSAPMDVMELQLLGVMAVSDLELHDLAAARAKFMHQKLKDSGKIDHARVLLADQNELVSTNQAARVFFNLR